MLENPNLMIFLKNFKQGKQREVGGDMRGDGFQNGGLLVVEKGGKVLYSFIQENPADHAQNEDILQVIHTCKIKSAKF